MTTKETLIASSPSGLVKLFRFDNIRGDGTVSDYLTRYMVMYKDTGLPLLPTEEEAMKLFKMINREGNDNDH